MAASRYIEIFREFVRAYNNDRLKEKFEEFRGAEDFELIKKYVFASLGLDYIENASYEDVAKAMKMKKMKGKVVVRIGNCGVRCVDKDGTSACQRACPFGAIEIDRDNATSIMNEHCTDCGLCVEACEHGGIIDKIEYLPLADHLKKQNDAYAIIAPAYVGQFGEDVTPGKLRKALKALGFKDMVEVALLADILTAKEALEFDKFILRDDEFMITSCCCPMWVAMVKKVYNDLVSHISPSVSPMVATGRSIKAVHKDAEVVFIGPCVAKKAEAKEHDVSDAIDFVLTFGELKEVLELSGINLTDICEDEGEHASRAGRIYAYTGGVSKAVSDTVDKLIPHREIKVKSVQANGVKECREILNALKNGELKANFVEGMGCVGGCVGGPKSILNKEKAKEVVHDYGNSTDMITPLDNPMVYSTLKSIGIEDIYQLIDHESSKMFERKF
jgi:iron only hydrogenase large subunit-like protein